MEDVTSDYCYIEKEGEDERESIMAHRSLHKLLAERIGFIGVFAIVWFIVRHVVVMLLLAAGLDRKAVRAFELAFLDKHRFGELDHLLELCCVAHRSKIFIGRQALILKQTNFRELRSVERVRRASSKFRVDGYGKKAQYTY